MKDTKIEWCDHSWSPWRGCTKVSPGCANCYAETLSKRNPDVLGQWGRGKPRVLAKNWVDPVKWDRARREESMREDRLVRKPTVFPSLCDWLDEDVPADWLARFLALIRDTPNLNWLLLTKRPEFWGQRMEAVWQWAHISRDPIRDWVSEYQRGNPPANVWVGTSCEDQTRSDQRIPALLRIPAAGRFLSVEPLLGPVDLATEENTFGDGSCADAQDKPEDWPEWVVSHGIQWVIIGGESGPGARPCNVEWIRSLVRQCEAAGVATFVKQLGANSVRLLGPEEYHPERPEGKAWPVFLKHPKGGDPAEWTDDVRVRKFPEGLR